MGTFIIYLLKASICLVAFYLFYRLLLSRETFHRFNRIAVLGILVLSLFLPFCEITVGKEAELHQTVLTLEQFFLLQDMQTEVVEQADSATIAPVHMILLVYVFGIFFLLGRHIYSLIKLYLLLRSGKKEALGDGIKLIIHNVQKLSPFSWMKYIVVSEDDLKENRHEILTHEWVHIRKNHTMDLLIADICILFQWFNPAVWLLKQELQTIHEYQADERVLKEGINAREYQLLLIKKAAGTRLYSMANSFNHSKLKKRITMMLKEKSSPWARLKYLYILPVTAIAITAFARPEISNELKEISNAKVSESTAIVDTIAPIFVVDDVKLSAETVKLIDPGQIVTLKALQGQSAVDLYGEEGRNGVIIITTKMNPVKDHAEVTGSKVDVNGVVKDKSGNPIAGASVIIEGTTIGTITGLDGKFQLSTDPDASIKVSFINKTTKKVKVSNAKVTVVLEDE